MARKDWQNSDYYKELEEEDKVIYKKQLFLTDETILRDPYGINDGWKNDVKLLVDISWPDIYNYLINTPSEYTHKNLRCIHTQSIREF